jgi:hypothetical protein
MNVEDAIAAEISAKLTEPMKTALRELDPDMFDHGKVHARGSVMGALRKRGIVAEAPHRHLTALGAQVATITQGRQA